MVVDYTLWEADYIYVLCEICLQTTKYFLFRYAIDELDVNAITQKLNKRLLYAIVNTPYFDVFEFDYIEIPKDCAEWLLTKHRKKQYLRCQRYKVVDK